MALVLSDFSGGLNLRDSPLELALNETPFALNWTLDQRGQLNWRKGWSNVATLPGNSGTAAFIFFSAALNLWLCVREGTSGIPHLWKRAADLSGSWTDVGTIGALSVAPTVVGFCDFPGSTPRAVISVPGPGIRTYDGTTISGGSTAIDTFALCLWKNRVWAAGYNHSDASGNPTRLFASKIGDSTVWSGADLLTVDLRDKDAQLLTGLGIAAGALIVFKRRSAYRVNDPGTGEYSTIDASAGCQGPLAVVTQRGRLYTWGADSLYEWDGIGPGKKVGDKARPLFATDAALIGGVPALCGGVNEDRALFAYPSSAGGNNDRLLDYDPQHGWLMRYQLASSSKDEISSFASKDADLYAACRDGDIMYKVGGATAGADDGTVFSGSYRTPWLQLGNGKTARVHRAQLEALLVAAGTNTLKLRVYKDFDLSAYDEFDVSADVRAPAGTTEMLPSIVRALGHARSFAFEFVAGTAAGAASVGSLALDPQQIER